MSELPPVITVENPEGMQMNTVFLPALLQDNPALLKRDPTYVDRLRQQGERLSRALLEGDWSAFVGQFLPEFSKMRHVCKPFEIPKTWTRYRGYDWGFADPAAMYWLAKDPASKRMYVYREFYEAGLTDPQQFERINDMTESWEKFTFSYADPSIWTQRTVERVAKSTYDVALDYRILFTRADNDQVSKARRLRSSLADIHDGRPGLMIFDTCTYLIVEIEGLMSDPDHPENPLPNQQDHGYDALCYGLTGYSPPILKTTDDNKPKQYQNPFAGVKGL